MTRHPNSRRFLQAQERFKAAVTAYIVSLGARPGRFYDYEIDTPAGLLHISIFGNWVATRFDDLALWRAFTASFGCPCNPYSGKWNHHFFNGTIASLHPDKVLPQLRYYFELLMAWEPEEAAMQ